MAGLSALPSASSPLLIELMSGGAQIGEVITAIVPPMIQPGGPVSMAMAPAMHCGQLPLGSVALTGLLWT